MIMLKPQLQPDLLKKEQTAFIPGENWTEIVRTVIKRITIQKDAG